MSAMTDREAIDEMIALAAQWRAWLHANGYAPVPVAIATKRPVHKNWPARARAGEFATATPEANSLNTGIECSGLQAVDIDIDDPIVAAGVMSTAEKILGPPGAKRLRVNSARTLYLYRAASGAPNARTRRRAAFRSAFSTGFLSAAPSC